MKDPVAPRYQVHVYICGASCLRKPELESWALFGDIFADRPNNCRYGVVLCVEPHLYEVWDFYADAITDRPRSSSFRKTPPAGVTVDQGDNLDALIMKWMARYDRS